MCLNIFFNLVSLSKSPDVTTDRLNDRTIPKEDHNDSILSVIHRMQPVSDSPDGKWRKNSIDSAEIYIDAEKSEIVHY